MTKVRKIRNHALAVPVDHPDGGTLHIYPIDAVRNGRLQDELQGLRYLHDVTGALVIQDGKPVEAETTNEKATRGKIDIFRRNLVEKITNVVNIDDPFELDEDGNPKLDDKGDPVLKLITITEPAAINDFLGEVSNHMVEREVALTEWRERQVTKESVIPSADGGEPTRIIETRTEVVCEPVIANGKATTEKRQVQANKPMVDWVLEQAQALVSSAEAETKNFSPTPVSSSV
ncbi:MAG TPA: hypothetical protein VLC46_20215 [Thermoanaerobaculia bacterium]|jgi:hypothetical protein|nr:hypothetical protein [Thermoanaerobaculia bacterium]